MSNHTDRALFLAMCYSQPLLRSDAVIVLCGEDAQARLHTGIKLVHAGLAPVMVLSGGVHTPPQRHGAEALVGEALGLGISPERVLVEHASQNTWEQAVNVVELALVNAWTSITIVASLYHLPRALLTFVRACDSRAADLRVRGMPCASTLWTGSPDGLNGVSRAELLHRDMAKISLYGGHCASYVRGVEHLKRSEQP